MEIEKEVLQSLVENNDAALNHVTKYYNLTKDIPLIASRSEEEYLEFLELLIQDRISEDFQAKEKKIFDYSPKRLDYSISDALYKVYGDDAMPYLTKEYIESNKTRYHL